MRPWILRAPADQGAAPGHVPVLLAEVLDALRPGPGVWLDGTLGDGGYTRAMLEAGAERVIAVDRDPTALARAARWAGRYEGRLALVEGRFGDLDEIAAGQGVPALEGVVLDIGVSSMQLDQPERGFSFLRDGPLDMRMGGEGPSAADVVNEATEAELADILFQFGEERASRRIAKAIVAARPIRTTGALVEAVASAVPRARPGQPHPATRSFQALRIAVNDELGELARALAAAERALAPGGVLAVVTFHSLEDRIVKRYLALRSGRRPAASRHAPEVGAGEPPRYELILRKPAAPSDPELAANPRARSARLRAGRRTDAPALPLDPKGLGLPGLAVAALQGGA